MANFKKILKDAFNSALLAEARVLPSDADIESCPSIYKAIEERYLNSYIEYGFQHQLAGDGGTMRGEGVYSSLELSGGIRRSAQGYGPVLLRGKVLGGFKNYIMFNADRYPSIKRQVLKYYGSLLTPDEQIDSIIKDPIDAAKVKREGVHLNNYPESIKICRKWGVRGMMYDDYVATVLPFDFSSVILWEVATGVSRSDTENSVKSKFFRVFDTEARERYERCFDWDFQLFGKYDYYDREKITLVETNREMYALVRNVGQGYNFVKLDTRMVTQPKPQELSDIWLPKPPSLPSLRTGIFRFEYRGINFFATVYLPGEGTPALWFPEDLSNLFSPKLESISDWVDLDMATLEEVYNEIKSVPQIYSTVSESLKSHFRKYVNEAIKQDNVSDFLSQNYVHLYKTVFRKDLESIFKYGQLRQFASMNDSWYSEGVYTCLSPNGLQFGRYGDCKLEMILVGGFYRFLIFDEKWAKRIYKENYTIEGQLMYLLPPDIAKKEIDKIHQRFGNNLSYFLTSNRTVDILNMMFHDGKGRGYRDEDGPDAAYYNKLFSKYNVRGAVYHGRADGFCAVCWNFNDVVPYRYSLDGGDTWKTDLFNFDEAKERASINGDVVKRFRYKYFKVNDGVVKCDINGNLMAVTCVETTPGKFNIINIENGNKISPVDFDEAPSISLKGIINFAYKGVSLRGIVYLPGTNGGAVWYPEDISRLYERPDVNSLNDWVDFTDLDEVVAEIKKM